MTHQKPDGRLFGIILDSITDGVFTVDHDWRITSFNRAAERITAIPRDQAIGQPCHDVFHANICMAACALRHTIETGEPVVDQLIDIVDARGRRIPIRISTAVLRDGHGDVAGGVETFRDVSAIEELRKEVARQYTFEDIVSKNHRVQEIFNILPDIADSDSTVLIEGASGTGKELFARAIHDLSRRRSQRFVAITCGALPDTLLESELFGYRAGAFTDAREDRPGRFALAEGGTIFLDEIGNVSPAMQTRLLRVLQERVYEPLGAVEPVRADVRVVAATNRSLDELVAEGVFRRDLYYRVNVVRLRLPELRDRREDIPLLLDHFVAKYNHLRSKEVVGGTDEVMALLMEYDFPGNVRELENVVEHAFVLCPGGLIETRHLPPEFRDRGPDGTGRGTGSPTLRELEAMHIADAVRRHGGSRTAAARELGIAPSTLFRKVKALGIPLPTRDGRSRR